MKQLFKFSIILLVIFACKRDKVDFIGPGFISVPEGFNVTNFTATPSPVNFLTDTVKLNATFTHNVSWILTIKGQLSTAIYQVRGTSAGLNNVLWKGSHDGVYFFRKGETATATLSFFGTAAIYSVDIVITEVPNYKTCGTFANNGDFENPALITPPNLWYPFGGANVEWGVDSFAIDYKGNLVPSVQGKSYYFIRGLGTQQVFVSGIQYGGAMLPALPATPNNVWVNMFIYGTGDANAAVDLEYQESDFDGPTSGYQGKEDDAWVAHITLGHKGWKLFSFKYSDLIPSANADFGGSGNKIQEPERLRSFDLVLLKQSNPDAPVEVYFDFPIVTVGGPFKPCK